MKRKKGLAVLKFMYFFTCSCLAIMRMHILTRQQLPM